MLLGPRISPGCAGPGQGSRPSVSRPGLHCATSGRPGVAVSLDCSMYQDNGHHIGSLAARRGAVQRSISVVSQCKTIAPTGPGRASSLPGASRGIPQPCPTSSPLVSGQARCFALPNRPLPRRRGSPPDPRPDGPSLRSGPPAGNAERVIAFEHWTSALRHFGQRVVILCSNEHMFELPSSNDLVGLLR